METMERYWLMLRQIPRYPVKIDGAELEARLRGEGYEISRRTIQRDLEKLSRIFPLHCDDQSKPYGWSWSRDAEGFALPGMSPTAALTLRLVDAHLATLLPPSVRTALQPYVLGAGKVLDGIGDNPLRAWPEKIRVIPAGQPLQPATVDEAVLAVVYDALLRERRFHCRYQPRGAEEVKEYEVSPLGLVSMDRQLYLVATLWDYEEPVLLRPHRMESAQLLEKAVQPPGNFSLDAYIARGELQFANSERTLRLELLFSKVVGNHLLETPLSDDQQVTEEKDGRLRVKATVQDTRQLRWWLLGFSAGVEVVKPKRLRDEFAATAATLAERYG
jgi:predicted DNA-binding transcriptional regulator YafY